MVDCRLDAFSTRRQTESGNHGCLAVLETVVHDGARHHHLLAWREVIARINRGPLLLYINLFILNAVLRQGVLMVRLKLS